MPNKLFWTKAVKKYRHTVVQTLAETGPTGGSWSEALIILLQDRSIVATGKNEGNRDERYKMEKLLLQESGHQHTPIQQRYITSGG